MGPDAGRICIALRLQAVAQRVADMDRTSFADAVCDAVDAARAVRFLSLSGAQGAAWAVETDELDGEFSRRRWHTRIGLAPAGDGGGASSTCRYRITP